MFRYLEDRNGEEIGWQQLEPMKDALRKISCVSFGEGIVVFGGKNEYLKEDPETLAKRVKKYDPFGRTRVYDHYMHMLCRVHKCAATFQNLE